MDTMGKIKRLVDMALKKMDDKQFWSKKSSREVLEADEVSIFTNGLKLETGTETGLSSLQQNANSMLRVMPLSVP